MTFFLNRTHLPYFNNQDQGLNTVANNSHDSVKINREERNNYVNQSFDIVLKKQILASLENQTPHDTAALQPSSGKAVNSNNDSPLPSSPERYLEYTIQPGDTLWSLAVQKYHVNVKDLVKDNEIQDPRKLQVGQKIKVRLPAYTEGTQEVVASWYGKDYQGKPMANGEPYNMYAETIAHRDLPLGTMVELSNPETGQRVIAKVTDRGPFIKGRDVDLSFNVAQRLSLVEKGVGKLSMRVLG